MSRREESYSEQDTAEDTADAQEYASDTEEWAGPPEYRAVRPKKWNPNEDPTWDHQPNTQQQFDEALSDGLAYYAARVRDPSNANNKELKAAMYRHFEAAGKIGKANGFGVNVEGLYTFMKMVIAPDTKFLNSKTPIKPMRQTVQETPSPQPRKRRPTSQSRKRKPTPPKPEKRRRGERKYL